MIYEIHIYTKDNHFRDGLTRSINNIQFNNIIIKLIDDKPEYIVCHQGKQVILLLDEHTQVTLPGYKHIIYLVSSINRKGYGIYKYQRIESIIYEALDLCGITLDTDMATSKCRIIAVASYLGGVGKSKLIEALMSLLPKSDKRCFLRLNNVLKDESLCLSDILWDVKSKSKAKHLRQCHYQTSTNLYEIGSFRYAEDYQNQNPIELIDSLRAYGECFDLTTLFIECMVSLDKLHEGIFKYVDSIIVLDDLSRSQDALAKEVYSQWLIEHSDARLVSTATCTGKFSSMLPYDDGTGKYNLAVHSFIVSGGGYG